MIFGSQTSDKLRAIIYKFCITLHILQQIPQNLGRYSTTPKIFRVFLKYCYLRVSDTGVIIFIRYGSWISAHTRTIGYTVTSRTGIMIPKNLSFCPFSVGSRKNYSMFATISFAL